MTKLREEVVCMSCGCLVAKGWEKTVEIIGLYNTRLVEYCGKCKPPYDQVELTGISDKYWKEVPASRVRVNLDGTPYHGGAI